MDWLIDTLDVWCPFHRSPEPVTCYIIIYENITELLFQTVERIIIMNIMNKSISNGSIILRNRMMTSSLSRSFRSSISITTRTGNGTNTRSFVTGIHRTSSPSTSIILSRQQQKQDFSTTSINKKQGVYDKISFIGAGKMAQGIVIISID